MLFFRPVPCEFLSIARHGDAEKFAEKSGARHHSARWRLTDLGLEQARALGAWIRQDSQGEIDRGLCGMYHRLLQTAKHMGLTCKWELKNYLRPRSRGNLDHHPEDRAVGRDLLHSTEDARLDGGETVAEMRDRAQRMLDSIYRNGWQTRRTVVMTAREVIWAAQANIEGWLDEDMELLLDPERRTEDMDIRCGELIQYACWHPDARLQPRKGDGLTKRIVRECAWTLSRIPGLLRAGVHYRSLSFCMRRRIAPMDSSRCTDWMPFKRKRYSGHELCAD